jgi:hypothetical protein
MLALLFVVFFGAGFANQIAYTQGNATVYVLAALCLTLLAGLAPVVALETILLWRVNAWPLLARVHYTFVALGMIALAWVFATWNLIGWHV